MKNLRMATALVVVALLLALVPASLAQDQTFGLSVEDKAVLDAANAATASATSAQFNFVANLTATSEGETLTLDLSGTGLFDQNENGEANFQLSLNGSADMGENGQMPLTAEIRVIDSTLYFMVPALLGPQWLSLSPDEVSGLSSDMGFDPAELAAGDMSSLEGAEGFGEMMAALAEVQPEQYISMTRNGDQFTTTIDLVGLISSEAFQSFIRSSVEANADSMDEISEADLDELNEMLAELPAALQDSSLTLDQYVTDGMISRTVLNVALNIDPSAVGEDEPAVSIALTFDISLSGYNQDYTIEVPEDAVSFAEMMSGMSASN